MRRRIPRSAATKGSRWTVTTAAAWRAPRPQLLVAFAAMRSAEVVVVGAGIGGIAAAHELAVVRGVRDVVIVDDRPPLTVTSDKSTECYRDWWPQPAMAALMGRSIARMEALAEETGNAFAMNR